MKLQWPCSSRPPCQSFHGLWIGALGALHHKAPEDARSRDMTRATTSLESWGAQNDKRLCQFTKLQRSPMMFDQTIQSPINHPISQSASVKSSNQLKVCRDPSGASGTKSGSTSWASQTHPASHSAGPVTQGTAREPPGPTYSHLKGVTLLSDSSQDT